MICSKSHMELVLSKIEMHARGEFLHVINYFSKSMDDLFF